jgi:hypothetical protein
MGKSMCLIHLPHILAVFVRCWMIFLREVVDLYYPTLDINICSTLVQVESMLRTSEHHLSPVIASHRPNEDTTVWVTAHAHLLYWLPNIDPFGVKVTSSVSQQEAPAPFVFTFISRHGDRIVTPETWLLNVLVSSSLTAEIELSSFYKAITWRVDKAPQRVLSYTSQKLLCYWSRDSPVNIVTG